MITQESRKCIRYVPFIVYDVAPDVFMYIYTSRIETDERDSGGGVGVRVNFAGKTLL